MSQRTKRQATVLRVFRKVHRLTGASLFVFFFVVAISGLLLGWKKHSGGTILPRSYEGTTTDLEEWLPIHVLHERAVQVFRDSVSTELSAEVERIDVRPDKGMVKFVFAEHYWGIQLDGATGALLHVERRRSDFIENVHDGSILDYALGTSDGQIKLVYTTVMGLALFTFTLTGFWLWYGPKRLRQRRRPPSPEAERRVPRPLAGGPPAP